MAKLKPIENLAGDVDSRDLVMLRLETSKDVCDNSVRKNTVAVGFLYSGGGKNFLPTSGMGSLKNETFTEVCNRLAVDISNGKYLGAKILGYKIVKRDCSA